MKTISARHHSASSFFSKAREGKEGLIDIGLNQSHTVGLSLSGKRSRPEELQTATGSGKDLPNLDVLRSLAVLAVMASHTLTVIFPGRSLGRYGPFGVALFFLHTALVLMWSIQRRPDVVNFYIRRSARVYPLAILVTLIVLATHIPVSVGKGYDYFTYTHLSGFQIAEHLLLVQNLFSGNQLLYVMWSLPLEIQMYLLLPLLFFFLQRVNSIMPLLAFWLLAWLFCAKEFSGVDLNLVYAICYFLPGVIAFQQFARPRHRLPAWLFIVVLLATFIAGGRSHDWHFAALPALALGLLLPHFEQLRTPLLTRPSWFIARYSYGIYLLHPFGLVLGFYMARNLPLPLQLAILIGSTAVLSMLAYHLIEQPCIRIGSRLATHWSQRNLSLSAVAENVPS